MRSEVNDYLDEWFWSVFDMWHRSKLMDRLPFSEGWADWPAHIAIAYETAEAAYRSAQHGSR